MKLLIIVESTDTGWSAFSPDLPGCIATGATRPEVEAAMASALEFHLEGLRIEGLEVPEPRSYAKVLEVAV